ncbi:hypothetical protein LAZ67_10003698 [Cordylochernes scorpioides]|uniref:Uncharacterized protein n=1 Tax=Cordylochernes scorpioides TaxID=51811 RepID=A0ABY6KX82_9ARAC|nr:hypothetical protein LAZ67_10003698 [Cordylochernes scorpioides]
MGSISVLSMPVEELQMRGCIPNDDCGIRRYKMFSEGREDVNDEERAGRPSTSTTDEKINEVEKIILANRRITVREVDEDLNISIGSCHARSNPPETPGFPPYSPDLAPCDFFLFPKLKRPMKGRRYATLEILKKHKSRDTF